MLAIGYLAGFFIVAAFGIEGGFAYMIRGTILSLVIIAAAWVVLVCLRWLLDRLLPPASDDTELSPLQARISAYRPAASAALGAIVVVLAGIAVLQAWGIGALSWLEQPVGRRTLGAALSIALVLVAAVLFWEAASNATERFLTAQHQEGGDLQRSARIRTLLPLLRKALFIFLSLMVVLISLSEIGVDTAPLLAGAGVIGLAIGFGAQKLVQDVITGVFILVEDALSVGDVVDVAGTGGVVEDMSIRSIRLRDLSGNVHTIPFSSVGTVTNMTKDFSYYLLDIRSRLSGRHRPGDASLRRDRRRHAEGAGVRFRYSRAAGSLGRRSVHGVRRHHQGTDQDQADQAMGRRSRIQSKDEKAF